MNRENIIKSECLLFIKINILFYLFNKGQYVGACDYMKMSSIVFIINDNQ